MESLLWNNKKNERFKYGCDFSIVKTIKVSKMIIQKELLNNVKDFGLNSYEAKLWVALLSRGVATAGELSDIANVPRSRSYDVLESLERKGFVIMKLGKPIKYIAVPPVDVIDRVKKNVVEEAESHTSILENLKKSDVLSELNLLFNTGIETIDPIELSGSLKSRKNIYLHLSSMIKNAKKSVIIMTTGNGFLRKIDALKNQLLKAKERGVKIKIISGDLPKQASSVLKKLHPSIQVKFGNSLGRFVVIDGKNTVILGSDDEKVHPDYDFGVWINTDYFAKSLVNIFEKSWSESDK
jgi:HTH-type transcriptional regulator, sugar sensing transcriptional regulator